MAADRVVCAQCGANNFATQAACWKCSANLAAGAGTLPPVAAPSAVTPRSVAAPTAPVVPRNAASESPTALWASIAMGVFFPAVGLVVGIVFLMLDDRRKTQIGWWNIAAGLIGTIVHTLLTGWLVSAMLTPMLFKALGSMSNMRSSQSSSMDAEVPNNLAGPGMPGGSTLFQNAPQ